jgi:hypothetical protein
MNSIEKYFEGEKLQCTIGLVISILFIALSIYFLFLQKPFYKGIAYSSLPLALLLLTICVAVVYRTPNDIRRVSAYYSTDQQKMLTDELPRMEKVMKNFSVIKKVEIVFFAIGLLLLILFWKNELVRGIAAGLMVQGIVLFLFDYYAAIRGETYFQFLKSL